MKQLARVLTGMAVAAVFLWLAFRNVSLSEVRLVFSTLSWQWLGPYIAISVLGIYLRAERWKQLIEREKVRVGRFTLFKGVMVGYLVNYAVPRLGEITRAMYVGVHEKLSRTSLMGTVVLERGFDVLVMALLAFWAFLFLLGDLVLVEQILGKWNIDLISSRLNLSVVLVAVLFLSGVILASWMLWRFVVKLSFYLPGVAQWKQFAEEVLTKFIDGLLSFRTVKNWPLFFIFTSAIWLCYVFMTYIPFTAFDLHTVYGLGLREALVLTVLSSVGVALPSPGGLGTYHWIVSGSLTMLYGVPEAVAISYAIVSHLVMMLIVLVFTPLLVSIPGIWGRKMPSDTSGSF